MSTPKKEWKWPLGIFIGYSIFAISTLAFVAFTFTQSRDLVVEDYYAQTLVFDEHKERVILAENLPNPLEINVNNDRLVMQFPVDQIAPGITGNIHLYRPSDASLDKNVNVSVDENGMQYIPVDELKRGVWRVKVNWISENLEYYKEADFFLQ